jgi:hypothetical protein
MCEPTSNPHEPPQARVKPRWERPSLTFLGDLKDLVRGSGKISGSPNDSDMMAFQKSPGQM